jgi:4-alpha-glucanotransferase
MELARWGRLLPPVVASHGAGTSVELNIPARDFGSALSWTIDLEGGARRTGSVATWDCPEIWRGEVEGTWMTRRRLDLPADLPSGYHDLAVRAGSATARSALVVSPRECYEPPAVAQGRRLWGVAIQLYTVRSRDNWGIGDFGDLRRIVRWLAPQGAGFIGLNPLHALSPAAPARGSPYSASSRHFLNIMYIAIPAVPEFGICARAQARAGESQFADRLLELRSAAHVDYAGVAQLKLEILQMLYEDFRDRHAAPETERGRRFRTFVEEGGELLASHARFDALDQYLVQTLSIPSGWMSWPERYQDPQGTAARQFAADHPQRIEFHCYLQWLAHEQLSEAQALAVELGMPIGLYGDYAVGSNPSGSETWVDKKSYRMDAEIGAPPDPLALKGQGWGIPPQDPFAMESGRLQGFARLIRNNMRYYGALRLDHVMSLFRLWWVAAGSSPMDGAYVHYPLNELLTVLTLESVRARCLVIGEDLGVVPDEIRRCMPEYGLYHYKVLLFEKEGGRFRRPHEFTRRALGTVTTHDMPTLRGYWEGRDIALRRELNLFPSPEVQNDVIREREHDRAALLDALREQGLQPEAPASPGDPFAPELAGALHMYLARSPTTLVALQIEDLLGMADPVNVPGTHDEYPNWQRKLSCTIEEIAARHDLDAAFAAIAQARSA